MIMVFPEQLIGSIGPYTILTIALFFLIINLVRALYHQLDGLFFH